MIESDFMGVTAFARLCGVCTRTIYNWTDQKQIPCIRSPGGHRRYLRADVRKFLQTYGYPVPDDLTGKRNLNAE